MTTRGEHKAATTARWVAPALLAMAAVIGATLLHADADRARARAGTLAMARSQTVLVARDLATTIAQADAARARHGPGDDAIADDRWRAVRMTVGALDDDTLTAALARRDRMVRDDRTRAGADLDAALATPTTRLRNALDRTSEAALAIARSRDEGATALAMIALLLAIGTTLLHRREPELAAATGEDDRLPTLAKLGKAIAHDLNNLLAVVIGGIELAQLKVRSGDAAGHLAAAHDAAERTAALARRLLSLDQPPLGAVETFDPAAALAASGFADVELALASRGTIMADPLALTDAVAALIGNARDATAGTDGTITLASCDVVGADSAAAAPGDHVAITVVDTGIGMPPDVQHRMFEPLFSARRQGNGLGLGCDAIARFVRDAGGTLAVTSAPGRGTTVELLLPAVAMPAPAIPIASANLGLRVLVIEDDPRVLTQTLAALTSLGHRPIACERPADLPGVLRTHRVLDLVLSDVALPGASGPELVAAIHLLHPGLPTIFMTGYAGDPAVFGRHLLLRKPYTIARLAEAIDQACGVAHERAA